MCQRMFEPDAALRPRCSPFVSAALGSFSRVFGTDWKERSSRDFVRVNKAVVWPPALDVHLSFCHVLLVPVSFM